MSKTLNEILEKYYEEANKGLQNDKPPSSLNRGEGTEKEYYIFKIDLVRSTSFLANRFPQTYLKLAHVFLSSIDEITRFYGADASQVEYAGDSVLAYFDSAKVQAIDVLVAAYWTREATYKIKTLDPVFNRYNFKSRIILHYGKLIMAKIGPWGDHRLSAIGKELHKVGKLEKKVLGGVGHATKEFGKRLELKARRNFLKGVYEDKRVECPKSSSASQVTPNTGNSLLSALSRKNAISSPPQTLLGGILSQSYGLPSTSHPTILTGATQETTYETERVLKHWEVKWQSVEKYLHLKRHKSPNT